MCSTDKKLLNPRTLSLETP